MKRPARVPSQLSESLHKRLGAYALPASAAGVGMLALAPPAGARIIYTPAHKVIPHGFPYPLNLTHHGANQFSLSIGSYRTCCDGRVILSGMRAIAGANYQNGSAQVLGAQSYASALKAGAKIGSQGPFSNRATDMGVVGWYSWYGFFFRGQWANSGKGVKDRYLGVRFIIEGKIHYGWARLRFDVSTGNQPWVNATLNGYAYQTIPNKPIKAGQTHGRDEATLGRLAQGASSVSRQK